MCSVTRSPQPVRPPTGGGAVGGAGYRPCRRTASSTSSTHARTGRAARTVSLNVGAAIPSSTKPWTGQGDVIHLRNSWHGRRRSIDRSLLRDGRPFSGLRAPGPGPRRGWPAEKNTAIRTTHILLTECQKLGITLRLSAKMGEVTINCVRRSHSRTIRAEAVCIGPCHLGPGAVPVSRFYVICFAKKRGVSGNHLHSLCWLCMLCRAETWHDACRGCI